MKHSARILGVGIATLDIINEVAAYPAEDAEVRALAQRRVRGGNVTNSLSVLAQLGHDCAWAGTLAEDSASRLILDDLRRQGIDTSHAVQVSGAASPVSYIALSRANGSRTILHYRDLPEFEAESFAAIALGDFDWIHFEGRHPAATRRMIRRVRDEQPDMGISLELEKPRPEMDLLLDGPHLVLASRAYAHAAGYQDPRAFLDAFMASGRTHLCVLAWGAEGAGYRARDGSMGWIPARAPQPIVDTLGAGDCFNAGMIDGLLRGLAPAEAVSRAVGLAGYKCSRNGLEGLVREARRAGVV